MEVNKDTLNIIAEFLDLSSRVALALTCVQYLAWIPIQASATGMERLYFHSIRAKHLELALFWLCDYFKFQRAAQWHQRAVTKANRLAGKTCNPDYILAVWERLNGPNFFYSGSGVSLIFLPDSFYGASESCTAEVLGQLACDTQTQFHWQIEAREDCFTSALEGALRGGNVALAKLLLIQGYALRMTGRRVVLAALRGGQAMLKMLFRHFVDNAGQLHKLIAPENSFGTPRSIWYEAAAESLREKYSDETCYTLWEELDKRNIIVSPGDVVETYSLGYTSKYRLVTRRVEMYLVLRARFQHHLCAVVTLIRDVQYAESYIPLLQQNGVGNQTIHMQLLGLENGWHGLRDAPAFWQAIHHLAPVYYSIHEIEFAVRNNIVGLIELPTGLLNVEAVPWSDIIDVMNYPVIPDRCAYLFRWVMTHRPQLKQAFLQKAPFCRFLLDTTEGRALADEFQLPLKRPRHDEEVEVIHIDIV
jgi:hypothetical protein